jgi:hypothetical protein
MSTSGTGFGADLQNVTNQGVHPGSVAVCTWGVPLASNPAPSTRFVALCMALPVGGASLKNRFRTDVARQQSEPSYFKKPS